MDAAVTKLLEVKAACGHIMPIMILNKPGDEDVYYSAKYRLLQEGLPLQVVTKQLLARRENLKWSAANIGLQIFAKMGGKPWKVFPTHEEGIILGIGQAHEEQNGSIVRYFAYSVCTDSSGLYQKVDVLGRSDNEVAYLAQLRSAVFAAIQQHLSAGRSRVVLHVPFRIRKREFQTICEAVKEAHAGQEESSFSVVVLRINQENKFFGYAHSNSMVPAESTVVQLSHKEFLVWFSGLRHEDETIFRRIPGPVYIEFHYCSRDITGYERDYLQEAVNLSGANWRGFNARGIPVSVYYCELIARFLAQFPGQASRLESMTNPWFL